jgi:hypothetical protein
MCLAGCLIVTAAPAPPETITYLDLQAKANHKLKDPFHSGRFPDNTLESLPTGEQKLEGVKFKIGASVIQLGSKQVMDKPEKVEGIKVDQRFAVLHILHATGYGTEDDTLLGEYVVHYENKTKETIEIVYGKDVIDWWFYPGSKEVTRSKKAWEGTNAAAKSYDATLRLYLTTWKNPKPDKKVVSIDYVSKMTDCAPFCVAMTVESK